MLIYQNLCKIIPKFVLYDSISSGKMTIFKIYLIYLLP